MTAPSRRRVSTIALAGAAGLVLTTAACSSGGSSSSSGGATPRPTSTLAEQGPAGNVQLTAPATLPPTKGAPGGSTVFPTIAPTESRKLQSEVAKLPGVRTVTYYTNFHQIQVYFDAGATADQRNAVERLITGH
jgi:hypothetical protein